MRLHAHGKDIMGVKGLLDLRQSPGPVVIQGVNHVVYPPEHLDDWKGIRRRTDLVFIVRNRDPRRRLDSFKVFVTAETGCIKTV
mgnify:FL=1